jgi:glucokinase
VHVLNDLTAAGFFYVSQGHSDFCVTAVGSGIGNKVFIRGRPQIGSQGFGGEIGHLKTQPMPRTPIADVRADLGEIASGRGTAGLARQWLARSATDAIDSVLADLTTDDSDEVWSRAIASAFADEDPLAQRIVEATAYPLAHALGSLHMSLGLERFFIVGGFAHALGAGYGRVLARLAAEACWDLGQRWTDMIQVGARGEEEGLLGACYLAQRMMKRSRLNPAEAA